MGNKSRNSAFSRSLYLFQSGSLQQRFRAIFCKGYFGNFPGIAHSCPVSVMLQEGNALANNIFLNMCVAGMEEVGCQPELVPVQGPGNVLAGTSRRLTCANG